MELVAAGQQGAQGDTGGPRHGERFLGHRCRHEAESNFRVAQPLRQAGRGGAQFVVHDMNAGAGGKVGPQFPDGGIKGNGGELGRAVCWSDAVGALVPGKQVDQAAV